MAIPFTPEVLAQKVQEKLGYVKETRRWMHEHPEVSQNEFESSKMNQQEVEKLGLPWERAAKTGLVVTMECGKPGKTIALRADIDALPVLEDPENLKGPKVCVSKNPGACHACGHDAHTSMMLGAMQLLYEVRDQLAGTILFCFEQGEEDNSGIAGMIEVLEKKKIDGSWGMHVYAALESGKICVDPGPRMAGNNHFEVTFRGKGGHGSRPDQAISPIFAVSDCLGNLGSAWINRIDVTKTVTLGVGYIKGGETYNVIPDEASFGGSMRFFDMAEGHKAGDLLQKIVHDTADMHGCQVARCDVTYLDSCINNEACSALAQTALNEVLPAGTVASCDAWFASESFGNYLSRWPGVLAFLGIKNDEKGTGALHHNPKFEIDEDVLSIGMTATVQYTQAFLDAQAFLNA